ncbi:MAG TPA: EAL domain-containing protein [Quisquiliibacterium sp.]|nr:EAL domain-containing protein [Quisquiliibacterium sp.]HQN11074.1 EAL domain-containing protein [Quisquiliibacterium sp.]HQP65180.1 EAL domain-containing protein [Quisquiliibacterium sp.]
MVVLALAIAVGLSAWVGQQRLSSSSGNKVPFKVFQATERRLPPSEALKQLASEKERTSFYTNRSTNDFWISIDIAQASLTTERAFVLELASKHATSTECWPLSRTGFSDTFTPTNEGNPLAARRSKAGYAIEFATADLAATGLLCRATFSGPARPTMMTWSVSNYQDAEENFNRAGGILFGALLALTAFSALTSALNREPTFAIYAIWLLAHLRIAAVSGGWDLGWVDFDVSAEIGATIRQLTLPIFALATSALFASLFKNEISQLGLRKWLIIPHSVAGLLMVAAIVLPNETFIPVMWILSAFGALTVLAQIAVIFAKAPSRVLGWYSLSWCFALTGIMGEVIGTATGMLWITKILNPVSGSIVSSLIVGISLAERLRSEKSGRLAAQKNALEFLQRFKDNYNGVSLALFTMRLDGRLREYNPAFADLFGIKPPLNSPPSVSWGDIFPDISIEDFKNLFNATGKTDSELKVSIVHGGLRWIRIRAALKDSVIEGSVEDITQRKEADFQLRFLAHHDPLTSLLNRRGFDTRFERAMSQVAQGESALLAYVDLDRFKLVNDLFGHVAGDNVLRQVADRLKARVQEPHSIARVGGDEFLILFVGMQPLEAKALCEEILDDIRTSPYQFQDKAFSVDASLGLTPLERNMSERDAISTCDRACSEAKRLGGAHVVLLNDKSEQVKQHLDEIRLIAEIRNSLPEDRLFTVFQPIVSLREPASSLCYEVLLRMRDDDGKTIPPGRFIAAAERNGLMTRIDRFVLTNTLEWLDRHPEHREHLSFTTLNISGASLNDERFIEDVRAIVREHPQSAPKLCFEITESVALYDLNGTRRFVDMIKAFGAMIALDDFGAGYTSFSYLKELRGDIVKIDGGFIRDINSNPANYAITRAIIDVSHELGMGCIAEWAETPDILASLMTLKADYAQGFVLAKPLDREVLLTTTNCGGLMKDAEVRRLLGLDPQIVTPARREPEQLLLSC